MQLLKTDAPDSFKETDKKKYSGKVVAVDASIALYQFLVQIRARDGDTGYSEQLTDADGNVTSHLQGFFNRTANLLENGIRPVFVFDGKPPSLKFAELAKRQETKKKASKEMEQATSQLENAENSDEEDLAMKDLDKASKRNIHVTRQQTEEVKFLLKLMGLPVIEAPCEAEAQCAELVKKGVVYASSTEDMDSLTFGTPIVLRKMTMPKSSKEKVVEIVVSRVLSGLDLTYDEFVDFCILCGCDYTESIKGIGPKTALKLVRKHKNIETIIENLPEKYIVPASLVDNLDEVRTLFKTPMVEPGENFDLVFNKPDKEGILAFLVDQKGFSQDRVEKVLSKIAGPKSSSKSRTTADEKQPTIDNFFKAKPKKETQTTKGV